MPYPSKRKRILFIGEAVTLAHVVRPVVLAQSLDPQRYSVTLACDTRYHRLFAEMPFELRSIRTIPSAQFLAALAKGNPVYDRDTLRSYVREDLEIIKEVKPDLVVGDFRISLAISTRLAGMPYFTITNAYWSPYSKLPFPLPEHPMTKVLGISLSQALFKLVRPLVFAYHTLPLNQVRREYGLPNLGYDLREIYTHADQTLYADIEGLVPTQQLPSHHHWLGPILWSPAVKFPDWWSRLPEDRPIVYVTFGSSGEGDVLPVVLQALRDLPVTVIAATAGRLVPTNPPANAWVTDFLPGTEAATRAGLVICNGGGPTTQQALAAGVPVIGIVSNMDQHLNMLCLEQVGAGIHLRAGKLNGQSLRTTSELLLNDKTYHERAKRIMEIIQNHYTRHVFAELVAAQF
ncbi:putative glycosyl transferase [Nitrosococcus halophilus Nc 4]|uniref:Glycosyl transferase n=1 Tax=Nitrosococcus halophilus (strain Nc4) TaxID=472759 RepID=D5C052_NITHN|nr:glycosyltransferase [Nitrosococcus halophilus]ADE16299.1 putative glycosyl transferase [Nitrosococcus halophilus Nc 4]